MTVKEAVQAVIDSKGYEPVEDAFYEVDMDAIEGGYIFRKPGDQYGVTAKGYRLVKSP